MKLIPLLVKLRWVLFFCACYQKLTIIIEMYFWTVRNTFYFRYGAANWRYQVQIGLSNRTSISVLRVIAVTADADDSGALLRDFGWLCVWSAQPSAVLMTLLATQRRPACLPACLLHSFITARGPYVRTFCFWFVTGGQDDDCDDIVVVILSEWLPSIVLLCRRKLRVLFSVCSSSPPTPN